MYADYPVRRHFCRWFLLVLDNALDTPLNRRQELCFYMTVHLHITAGRLETF
jgi:hypothetical protein